MSLIGSSLSMLPPEVRSVSLTELRIFKITSVKNAGTSKSKYAISMPKTLTPQKGNERIIVYNTGKMLILYYTNTDTDVKHKVLSLHISIWILQYTNLQRRRLSIQMQFYSNHKHTRHSMYPRLLLYMIPQATRISHKLLNYNNMAVCFLLL